MSTRIADPDRILLDHLELAAERAAAIGRLTAAIERAAALRVLQAELPDQIRVADRAVYEAYDELGISRPWRDDPPSAFTFTSSAAAAPPPPAAPQPAAAAPPEPDAPAPAGQRSQEPAGGTGEPEKEPAGEAPSAGTTPARKTPPRTGGRPLGATSQRILDELARNTLSADELVGLVGEPEKDVKGRIFALIRSGRITVDRATDPPRYRLAPTAQQRELSSALMAAAGDPEDDR